MGFWAIRSGAFFFIGNLFREDGLAVTPVVVAEVAAGEVEKFDGRIDEQDRPAIGVTDANNLGKFGRRNRYPSPSRSGRMGRWQRGRPLELPPFVPRGGVLTRSPNSRII